MDDVTFAGCVPGAIGRLVELHGAYYAKEWGFGLSFEAQVAAGLAEFVQRLDPARDGFWSVSLGGRVMGGVAIDGLRARSEGAHLRWFILADELRGRGLGGRLLGAAVGFCRRCGHPGVHLWTFQGLDAARRLYERQGFRLAEESPGERWGTRVLEQKFVLALA